MSVKIKSILKKVMVIALCIISVSTALVSSIPTADAATSILGTNAALGSPVLNSKATTENWNKWEIICWGVYLSNFCQPAIDDYESAFSTSSTTGSKGSGFQALCFGSGSDSTNNDIIENLCSYAIKVQKSTALKTVYVSYSKVLNGEVVDTVDPNNLPDGTDASSVLREATFKDFLFNYTVPSGADIHDVNTVQTSAIYNNKDSSSTYSASAYIDEGYIPTFYVRGAVNQSKYVTILDFMDSWDLQMFSSMCNSIRDSSVTDYKKAFADAVDSLYGASTPVSIGLDCFGNLVTQDYKMLFPAAGNQNITVNKSINILNSWVMNSYVSTASSESIIQKLHQSKMDSKLGQFIAGLGQSGSTDLEYAGLPAFGDSDFNNTGFLFYDMDSIALNKEYKSAGTSYGEYMKELFSIDIKNDSNKYPLEYEIAGTTNMIYVFPFITDTDSFSRLMQNTIITASALPNSVNNTASAAPVLHEIVNTDGTKATLIGENPVVVPVQVVLDSKDKFSSNGAALRAFYNWLYQVYTGRVSDSTASIFNKSRLDNILSSVTSLSDLNNNADELWDYFTATNPKYKDAGKPSTWDIGKNESIDAGCSRLVLVYPSSNIMRSVSSILSIKEGAEFKTYATLIYMTYLDWYGVVNKTTQTTGRESVSDFDPEIFDPNSDLLKIDPADELELMSEEDLESEVLQMSYLMLSPEAGRSYRKEIMYNGIADFLYEQYNRIVYGGASSIYSGTSTKSNTGFLAVPTFSENFLTSWFLESYVDIAVIAIMLCSILVIIIGLLKSRKLSWFILAIFTVVNVILLVPSTGEITPSITTSFTQNIFSSKMTYWTLSEGISNASLEADAYAQTGDFAELSSEESSIVMGLVNRLAVVFTDRSLMLKQDISQKIMQKPDGETYTSIQSLQSARWILPMVMQQFSADSENVENYLYVKLSNVWDDASNLYWYYSPNEASSATSATLTSQQFANGEATTAENNTTNNGNRNFYSGTTGGEYISTSYYSDYKEPTWADDTNTNINYANYSYTLRDDNNSNVHLYSYILHDATLNFGSTSLQREAVFGSNMENYRNPDSWQTWIDTANSTLSKSAWATTKDGSYGYERIADSYDRSDATTMNDGYFYYKMTESPLYYFFAVTKDSFLDDRSIGAIIGRLQGQIKETPDGEEVRHNFMYATSTSEKEQESTGGTSIANSDVTYTGLVRDVLDLQEFFTNTLPYMYEMTIATGGFDGESGILGSDEISDTSQYYEGNKQSWAYRSNWAVKLMENNTLSAPTTARKADGTRVTIANPLLPESYPDDRPMIFSEAQRYAYGLEESDLTLVELKCIAVNRDTARNWTLLVNYAGTPGITKEVFYRVMATSATEIFSQEFSTNGILDTRYQLYPQSVDLRYLSFDAIMKMLMINVSKNTSYAYGDTMDTLLTDSDLVTAFMLLLCSVLCVWIIPFCQQAIMAAIFYLGFIAIIKALFSSAAYKGRIAGAQLVSNLMFMVYTLVYYGLIGLMLSMSSSDEVLSINSVSTSPGNPFWALLIVVALSCVYVFLMYKHFCFCFAHYRDMGAEMVGFMTGAIVDKLQSTVGSVRDSISDFMSGESFENRSSGASGINGTGINNETTQNVNITNSKESAINLTSGNDDLDNTFIDENSAASYSTGETVIHDTDTSSVDIDAEIKTGEQLDDES